jgi:hypothetical protein
MTGCFGAIDNVDAEDNDENETTIVNNYYYNNTTSTTTEQNIEYFSIGGTYDFDEMIQDEDSMLYTVFNFSTNAGELVEVLFFDYWGAGFSIKTFCDDGAENGFDGAYLYGSYSSCYHLVRAYSLTNELGFNLVYSVLETTPTDLNANQG